MINYKVHYLFDQLAAARLDQDVGIKLAHSTVSEKRCASKLLEMPLRLPDLPYLKLR